MSTESPSPRTGPDIESLAPPTAGAASTVDHPAPADVPVSARLDPDQFQRDSVETKTAPGGSGHAYSIRIAKHASGLGECEDAVEVDPTRTVLAVADGASSSFGAQLWARALAARFVKSPPRPLSIAGFAQWLDDARHDTAGKPDDASQWWSEQGARDGAFSTITGAAIGTDGADRFATIMNVGDSCAFVLAGAPGHRRLRRSLPYEDATQFGSHPALLRSVGGRPHDDPSWTSIPVSAGDLIVLATDAVSEWLLGDPARFSLLDGVGVDDVVRRLVDERTAGRIVNDDLTVAVLQVPTV